MFPLYSPNVAGIEVMRRGRVRRAKLYYLRGLTGKAARITERQGKRGKLPVIPTEGVAAAPVTEADVAPAPKA